MADRKKLQIQLENTLDEVINLMKVYNREIGGYSTDIVTKLTKLLELSNVNACSVGNGSNEELSIRKKISKTLLAMGIPTTLSAHSYIVDLVEMGIEDIQNVKPFKTVGYPKMYEKYHRSAGVIEQAIRKSIEDGLDENNFEVWVQITGYSKDFPTVNQLITGLIEHFKN